MPEGHTIHRAASDHRKLLLGQAVALSSPQGRFADGARRLDGRICRAVEAWGKHLLYHFEDAPVLHIHLGLFGRIRKRRMPASPPTGQVRVRLEGSTHYLDFHGPTVCEVLDAAGLGSLLGRLGPDPLRADADPANAWARIARSRTPIGLLLMDQSVMAGIGNIYRTEILWRQRVHPELPGRQLDSITFAALWQDARELLALGARHNAIITVEDAVPARSRYRERVNIFGKTECPACGGSLRRLLLAQRKAYVCENCQPRESGGPLRTASPCR